MATLTKPARPSRRTKARAKAPARSIREVCLLAHQPQLARAPGDRVELAGRLYRVTLAEGDANPGYLHLQPVPAS